MSKKKKKTKKKGKTMTEILDAAGMTSPFPREEEEVKNPLQVSHKEFQEFMKRLENGERLNMAEKVKIRAHLSFCMTCPVSDKAAEAYQGMD